MGTPLMCLRIMLARSIERTRASPAPETVQRAAITLRRPARPTLANEHGWLAPDDGSGWAVIDEARRRDGCSDPLADDRHHLEDPRSLHERLDAVADLHRRRRLRRGAVDADVPAAARGRRR